MSIKEDITKKNCDQSYYNANPYQADLMREDYHLNHYSDDLDGNPKKNNKSESDQLEMLDQHSVKESCRNASSSFWIIWEECRDDLYFKCLGWMNWNSADTEDILSQVAIKAWEKWADYAEVVHSPKAWLMRLCHNLCVDMHRKQSQCALGFDDIELVAGTVQETNQNSSNFSPETEILQRELENRIHYAIAELPERLRNPFILYILRGLSYSEIAQELMLSEVNVRKRIQQAREQLRPKLQRYLSGLDNTVVAEIDLNEQWPLEPLCSSLEKKERSEVVYHYWRTATCLEDLAHTWSQSPGLQEWS